MWCHLLLFMPVIGLGLFFIFPWAVAFPAYAIVSVMSVFMYYKIMKAMGKPVQSGREALLGATATVVRATDSTGQVRYRNELWSAVSEESLRPGQSVRIVGFRGMKLVVNDTSRNEAEASHQAHSQ